MLIVFVVGVRLCFLFGGVGVGVVSIVGVVAASVDMAIAGRKKKFGYP